MPIRYTRLPKELKRCDTAEPSDIGGMMARTSVLLRAGVICLTLSLAAALLLAGMTDVLGRHRTLLELDTWLERTLFWVGLILVAGFVSSESSWNAAIDSCRYSRPGVSSTVGTRSR